MTDIEFDGKRFASKIAGNRKRLRQTIREAAKDIGISPATLSRVENEKMPDVLTMYKCCQWMCTMMDAFIIDVNKSGIIHTQHTTFVKHG